MSSQANLGVPGAKPWPARQAATETAWLLGAPFFAVVMRTSRRFG